MTQSQNSCNRFPFAHTFSIVARDPENGQLGVAVQSHWFSVGSIVAHAEAGVGAVASQAQGNPIYGHLGINMMRFGKTSQEALNALKSTDENQASRQVAMVNAKGEVAVHTGSRCIVHAGHVLGENEGFSVQANMMANADIWPAMAMAYRTTTGDLAERMIAALQAAQKAGGDVRGQQSAAILIVAGESTGRPWVGADIIMDLRVEDHAEPIVELSRLVDLKRVYGLMSTGDKLMTSGKTEEALGMYKKATGMVPEQIEFPFWHAVTLTEIGRLEEALPIFKKVFTQNPAWADLIQNLPVANLLKDDPELMKRILDQRK